MTDFKDRGSAKLQTLIRGLRQQGLIAWLFACGVAAASFLAFVLERLQHRMVTNSDRTGGVLLLAIMMIAWSHGFLAFRIAGVADALAEIHEPSAPTETTEEAQ